MWALCVYFESPPDDARWRFVARWSVQLVLALLIHPYLAAMSAAICAASLARGIQWSLPSIRLRGTLFVELATILVLVGTATGHFSKRMHRGSAGCCYGDASHNLASLVVPNPTKSRIWSDTPGAALDQTGLQWDGSMFLGFGVLLVLVVLLVRAPREVGRALRRNVALCTVLVGMLAFAASNHAYFLDHALWRFDVPKAFEHFANTFRACGRFAWPFGYAIAVGVLALAFRHLRKIEALAVGSVCVVLNLVDAGPTFTVVRAATSVGTPPNIDHDALAQAIRAHRAVEQWPSYQCLSVQLPFVESKSRELQFFAAKEGRPITGMRAARYTAKCRHELTLWKPLQTRPGALAFYIRATSPTTLPPTCRPLDAWVICTDQWDRPAMAPLRALAEAEVTPALAPGAVIELGPEKQGSRFLDGGWGTILDVETMRLGDDTARLRATVEPGHYVLAFDVVAHGRATLHISVDNVPQVSQVLEEGSSRVVTEPLSLAGTLSVGVWADDPVPLFSWLGIRAVTLQPVTDEVP